MSVRVPNITWIWCGPKGEQWRCPAVWFEGFQPTLQKCETILQRLLAPNFEQTSFTPWHRPGLILGGSCPDIRTSPHGLGAQSPLYSASLMVPRCRCSKIDESRCTATTFKYVEGRPGSTQPPEVGTELAVPFVYFNTAVLYVQSVCWIGRAGHLCHLPGGGLRYEFV